VIDESSNRTVVHYDEPSSLVVNKVKSRVYKQAPSNQSSCPSQINESIKGSIPRIGTVTSQMKDTSKILPGSMISEKNKTELKQKDTKTSSIEINRSKVMVDNIFTFNNDPNIV